MDEPKLRSTVLKTAFGNIVSRSQTSFLPYADDQKPTLRLGGHRQPNNNFKNTATDWRENTDKVNSKFPIE